MSGPGAAGAGTLVGLHRAVKARMESVAEAFWGLETKTTNRAPRVIGGWVVPKGPLVEEFPFIIVRPSSGSDSSEEQNDRARIPDAVATFKLIVGTYSDDDDGFLDVLNVIDAIRHSLLSAPTLLLADEQDEDQATACEHVGPLLWELPASNPDESQPRPQWFGVVTTTFRLPRPEREPTENEQ